MPPTLPEKKKIVLDFEPAVVGYPSSDERKELASTGRSKRRWGKIVGLGAGGVLFVALVAGVIAMLTLPGCVKRECIDAARARGIALTIGDVRVGPGRFTLVDVTATSQELPGINAKAAEIDVDMSGLDAKVVTARRGELVIDGTFDEVKQRFTKWRAAHAGTIPGEARGGPGVATLLVLDGTHVVWTKAFGAHVKLDVLEMHAELGRKGSDDDVHVTTPHLLATVDAVTIGPWRLTYDRTGASARTRIAFDPALPDGPSALFVTEGERVASTDVTIARSQLANIGVAPATVGLGPSTQIEAQIHFTHPVPNRADATAKLALYGLKLAQVPTPLDAKLDLVIGGDPSAGAEVKKGTLAVGPMSGAVTGTLKVLDDAIRTDLGWKAGPLPCSAFATLAPPVPKGAPPGLGDLAAELGQFAQATGIAKVTGEVRMDGSLVLDSRDFGLAKVTFTPTATCDVSIFGQKAP
jgi:hypothetical protein